MSGQGENVDNANGEQNDNVVHNHVNNGNNEVRHNQNVKPASSYNVPILEVESDSKGSNFDVWVRKWNAYILITGLNQQPVETQLAALTLALSDEACKIFDHLPPEDCTSTNAVINALKRHVKGQVNVIIERRNFYLRDQLEGESFDDWLTELKDLMKSCQFCDNCHDSMLRDRIVVRHHDSTTVQILLAKKDLDLSTTVETCQAQESANKNRDEIKGEFSCKVSKYRKSKSTNHSNSDVETKKPCGKCGKNQHPPDKCPAKDSTCGKCSKKGHFTTVCRSGKTNMKKSASKPRLSLITARIARIERSPRVQILMKPNRLQKDELKIPAMPDTGSEISAIGKDLMNKFKIKSHDLFEDDDQPIFKSADNHDIENLGVFYATVKLGNKTKEEKFHILKGVQGCILSWKTTQALGIIPEDYPRQISTNTAEMKEIHHSVKVDNGSTKMKSEDIIKEFPTVFNDEIKPMPGEEFVIQLTDDAVPFCVATPRRVAYAYRDKLKKELDDLVSKKIIEPVTYPTAWCAPLVVSPKKGSDDIRLCVDLSHLNKYVKRERYQSPTPAEAVADIAATKSKWFTTIDALKGYHQCPLDKKSQDYTTFITPFGRYKYVRAPFGICSISEHYNRRMDEAFIGLQGYRRIVDDVTIYDNGFDSHLEHVRQFLQRCHERGITLKKEKFKFAQQKVEFAGFILSADGYSPDPKIIQAITDYPAPTNITDVRSFMGLVNQLGSFSSKIAAATENFRPLLRPKNEFQWNEIHQKSFEETKKMLSSTPTLAYFDPSKPTSLQTDASRLNGLGFVLLQLHDDEWKLVQAGSRYLTETEARYAMIEIELLAVAWSVKKCNPFLAGLDQFEIVTDHKPLIPIMNNHRLDEIENPRLQRLRMKLLPYKFKAVWKKGKDHAAPDALSRAPVLTPTADDQDFFDDDVDTLHLDLIRQAVKDADLDPRLSDIRQASTVDQEYQNLIKVVRSGFPDARNQLLQELKPYWNVRDQISIDDNLIVVGPRLLIPKSLRQKIINELHASHQGITRTKARARLIVYWPGIDNDIENIVRSCKACTEELPSQPKEPMSNRNPEPNRVFQHICADLGSFGGEQWLIMSDVLSGWPLVHRLGKYSTTNQIIKSFQDSFMESSIPEIVWTDGGPQFTSKTMKDFFKLWGIQHKVSSPHYAQSNGKAEATVKSMKKLIRRCWTGRRINMNKWITALLQFKNTPKADGISPAVKVFGHPLRDNLPAHRRSFAPEWQKIIADAEEKSSSNSKKVEQRYNKTSKPLPLLSVGNKVVIQNDRTKRWTINGTIVRIGNHKDYFIATDGGRVLRRNRKFIRRRYPLIPLPKPKAIERIPTPPVANSPDVPRTPVSPQISRNWRSSRQRRPPKRLNL